MVNRFVSARSGAAIRFAVTVTIVDLIAIRLFPAPGVPMFASFSVVAALYFLDFDGSWRERLGGYALATIVGILGVCLGALVAGTLWVAVAAAFVVAFGFAFARVLRGYVARSAVGVQLAFLLCLLTPAVPGELPSYAAAWLLGSVASIVSALLVFPRRHTGQIRAAIATWCEHARDLADGLGKPDDVAVYSRLETARDNVRTLGTGTVVRPGLVSRRMRALERMRIHVEQSTQTMGAFVGRGASDPRPGTGRAGDGGTGDAVAPDGDARHGEVLEAEPCNGQGHHESELSTATHEGFEVAADSVRAGSGAIDLAPVGRARAHDEQAALAWTKSALNGRPGSAVDALDRHNGHRVLSISADVMQNLGARSCGAQLTDPELGLGIGRSVAAQLRDSLSVRSVWFRNSIRTAVAVAAAVFVARALGLEHGFWVAMASLSLIQVTFTSGASSKSAFRTAGGVVAGVATAGVLMWILPQPWMFLALLPIVAFFAKWAVNGDPLLGQFAYTPFAVINLAVLSWPQPIGVTAVRLEDVLIGVGVGLVATLLVFPHGQAKLIAVTLSTARVQSARALAAATALLADPTPNWDRAQAEQERLAQDTTRFVDAVDASYMGERQQTPELSELSAQEAWLFEVLLVTAIFHRFASLEERPAAIGELAAALTSDGQEHRAGVWQFSKTDPVVCSRHPRALVTATWAAWWLDHVTSTRRSREQDPCGGNLDRAEPGERRQA